MRSKQSETFGTVAELIGVLEEKQRWQELHEIRDEMNRLVDRLDTVLSSCFEEARVMSQPGLLVSGESSSCKSNSFVVPCEEPKLESNPVPTVNEDGFCVGDIVRIEWDRSLSWSRPKRRWKKSRVEGLEATVHRVTKCYVFCYVEGVEGEMKKRNHNVTLLVPCRGKECVLVPSSGIVSRRSALQLPMNQHGC